MCQLRSLVYGCAISKQKLSHGLPYPQLKLGGIRKKKTQRVKPCETTFTRSESSPARPSGVCNLDRVKPCEGFSHDQLWQSMSLFGARLGGALRESLFHRSMLTGLPPLIDYESLTDHAVEVFTPDVIDFDLTCAFDKPLILIVVAGNQ